MRRVGRDTYTEIYFWSCNPDPSIGTYFKVSRARPWHAAPPRRSGAKGHPKAVEAEVARPLAEV